MAKFIREKQTSGDLFIMLKLRDYQIKAVDSLRDSIKQGLTKIGLQMVTGAGKTIAAKEVVKLCLKNKKKVFFIVKGNKLLTQTLNVFKDYDCGVLWAEKTRNLSRNFIVCSAPTYITSRSRWKKVLQKGDVFIIDEAHDCTSEGYKALLSDIPKGKVVIGLSATFLRKSTGEGHTYWQNIIYPVTGAELKKLGVLPECRVYSPEIDYDLSKVSTSQGDYNKKELYSAISKSKTLYGNMIKQYLQKNPQKLPAIAFCINIEHCKEVAEKFRKYEITPIIIHSRLSQEKKNAFEQNYKYLLASKIPFIICSVDMLSRGVDMPDLMFGLHLRPTKSKLLYFQQFGRLTRKNKEGEVTKILVDLTPNYSRFGSPYRYIPPEMESISKTKRPKRPSIRRCKECGAVNPPNLIRCIVCKADMYTPIEIQELDFELREATLGEIDEKIEGRIKQINHFKDKYKLGKDYQWNDVKRRFGDDSFFQSKVVPQEQKYKALKKDRWF